MTPEALLDRLLRDGVFAETDTGELRLTDDFEAAIRPTGGGVAPSESTFGAVLAALESFSPSLDARDGARAALTLTAGMDPVHTDGVPAAFIPVTGESLPAVLGAVDRALVYVWREDCPPCADMRSALDAVEAALPPSVVPLAVYGPAVVEVLAERYDVGGAPTTLFVVDGRVDARIVGAVEPAYLRTELAASVGAVEE